MRKNTQYLQTKMTLAATALIMAVPICLPAMEADDAPESVSIDSMTELYGPVEFDHLLHAGYASCVECHHHTTGHTVSDPNCLRCHENTPENDTVSCQGCHEAERFNEKYLTTLESPHLYHIDKPGLKGAYHLNCIGCHETVDGPTGCQDCHLITAAGEKRFNTGKYAPASGSTTKKRH